MPNLPLLDLLPQVAIGLPGFVELPPLLLCELPPPLLGLVRRCRQRAVLGLELLDPSRERRAIRK